MGGGDAISLQYTAHPHLHVHHHGEQPVAEGVGSAKWTVSSDQRRAAVAVQALRATAAGMMTSGISILQSDQVSDVQITPLVLEILRDKPPVAMMRLVLAAK